VFDPSALYSFLKWAAPILGATGFALKMRTDVLKRADDWANKLLNNHLNHIQTATMETVAETKTTNKLLAAAALKDIETANRVTEVKETLIEHHDREQQVWGGILNTLSVLEDRTRRSRPSTRRKK
jgi:hypothetical protein